MEMLTATDPGESAALIARASPTAVFLDLSAQDLASPAAVEGYRKAAGGSIPIIAFGSHVDTEALNRARALGCTAMPRSRIFGAARRAHQELRRCSSGSV